MNPAEKMGDFLSLTKNEAFAIYDKGQDYIVSVLMTYSAEIEKRA